MVFIIHMVKQIEPGLTTCKTSFLTLVPPFQHNYSKSHRYGYMYIFKPQSQQYCKHKVQTTTTKLKIVPVKESGLGARRELGDSRGHS